MIYKSQENAVYPAIHLTTCRSGGFLAHGVLNGSNGGLLLLPVKAKFGSINAPSVLK